jgi:hypothetical protein
MNTSASLGSSAPNAGQQEFLGEVDIGGGRKLYLECHGTGAPTVILESGYHDSSQPWSLSDAYPPPVLLGVTGFTKVCAYGDHQMQKGFHSRTWSVSGLKGPKIWSNLSATPPTSSPPVATITSKSINPISSYNRSD